MNQTELGNICKLRNGYAFKSDDFINDGIPIVRIGDINNGNINLDSTIKVKEKDLFNSFLIQKGAILIAMSGATTGKIGKYSSDTKAYQNQRVGCFIPDNDKINNEYLYCFLKTLKDKILQKAYGGGQPNISPKDIESLKIPLPPLNDQIRIADLLTRAEKLIAKRKESIKSLDEFLKSTFLEMFGDYNNPKYKTDSLNNYSLKITDGTHQSPKFIDRGVPFLLVSNIVNNEICYDTKKYISEKEFLELNKRTPIEVGDLLFTSVGSYGNAAIVKSNTKFAFQRHIAYIKPDKAKINPVYLFGAMMSDFVKIQVDRAVRGVAQLTLNLTDLKQIQIPLPPLDVQNQFAAIVKKVESMKVKYNESLVEMEKLYGGLSQRAFRGEL